MALSAELCVGLGGFTAGSICMWLRACGIRAELLRTRFAAEHDCLTGLPNRSGLRRHYECSHGGRQSVLALLDLDGFKQVNDTFGHDSGGRFLKEVADRLFEACGRTSRVGRLGGDEFLIVLPPLTLAEAATAVKTILSSIEAPIAAPDGTMLAVRASVGIAPVVADGTWSSQLRCADIALYNAKRRGGAVVQFQEGMLHPNCSTRPRELLGSLQPDERVLRESTLLRRL